jgi:hypothetical protein
MGIVCIFTSNATTEDRDLLLWPPRSKVLVLGMRAAHYRPL